MGKQLKPEDALQVAVLDFLRNAIPDPKIIVHVRNEAPRGKWGHAHAVRMGLLQGHPDLMIYTPGKVAGIELKAGKNTTTAHQKQAQADFGRVGIPVTVCYSVEAVAEALRFAGIEIRGEVTA